MRSDEASPRRSWRGNRSIASAPLPMISGCGGAIARRPFVVVIIDDCNIERR
jgi:hypothetical protein